MTFSPWTLAGAQTNSFAISAKSYGAAGDGVTDDTTALTNWVNAINAAGNGAWAFLNPGNYIINSPLPTITRAGTIIQGAGWTQTAGTAGSTIKAGASWVSTTAMLTLGAEGIQLQGVNIHAGDIAPNAVAVAGANCSITNSAVQHVAATAVTTPGLPASGTPVTNTTGQAVTVTITGGTVSAVSVTQPSGGAQSWGAAPVLLFLANGASITLTYSVIPTSWAWTGMGVCVEDQNAGNTLWLTNNRINGINYPNIGVLVNATDLIMAGNKPVNVQYGVLLIDGASGALIENNHITPGATNGYTCVWDYGTASHIVIQGNRFDNYTRNAVQLTPPTSTPSDIVIQGNDFHSTTQTDNTFALVALDTTQNGIRHLKVRNNNAWSGGSNRPAYAVACLAVDGTTAGTTSRLGSANFGIDVSGNSAWVANAFFPAGQTPFTAYDNKVTTTGTSDSQQADTYATYVATGSVQPGNNTTAGGHLWSGSGAPNIAASVAGDYYLRTDTPGTANQRLYVATAGNTWSAIL